MANLKLVLAVALLVAALPGCTDDGGMCDGCSDASREGQRLSGLELRARPSDLRVRVRGATILIDVDLEGPAPAEAEQR